MEGGAATKKVISRSKVGAVKVFSIRMRGVVKHCNCTQPLASLGYKQNYLEGGLRGRKENYYGTPFCHL